MKKKPLLLLLALTFSFVILYVGFMFNSFRAGHPKQFKNFSGHEYLVVGRMLKSSQDGIFSAGGFCGRCVTNDTLRIDVQHHFSGYLDGGMPFC